MALGSASVRHCRLRLSFPEHMREDLTNFFFGNSSILHFLGGAQSRRHSEVTVESGGNFEDYKLVYIRFLSCHLFGPVNHGQAWRGWERSGEKGLIINDNQAQTWLIITIDDTFTGDLPLIITISDTCKNQPKRLDFDNSINLSSLIVSLAGEKRRFRETVDTVAGEAAGRGIEKLENKRKKEAQKLENTGTERGREA